MCRRTKCFPSSASQTCESLLPHTSRRAELAAAVRSCYVTKRFAGLACAAGAEGSPHVFRVLHYQVDASDAIITAPAICPSFAACSPGANLVINGLGGTLPSEQWSTLIHELGHTWGLSQ